MDPHLVLDLKKTFTCVVPFLNLTKLSAQTTSSPTRCLLTLLNRARSKAQLLEQMEKMMVQGVGLLEISRVFMRMNGVYKQASIER